MFICFELKKNQPNAAATANRRISATEYVLEIHRTDGDGPFYPHIAEATTPDSYRFFAGRLCRVPASDRLPANHAVASGNADDWNFSNGEPEGSWLALKFDRQRDVVSITSDLFLLQRWFYGNLDGSWYLSNSLLFLKRILGNRADVEPRSIPYMLLMGYLPLDYTPLQNIFGLPTGRALTVIKGEARIEVRAKLAIHKRPEIAAEKAPRLIADAIQDAVENELAGLDSINLPLSGGMDSRYILGCALKVLPPEKITTRTFGYPKSLDLRIGSSLANKLGIKNIALPMDIRPIGEILQDAFPNTEGMYWVYPDYPVRSVDESLSGNLFRLSGYIGETVFGSYDVPPEELKYAEGDQDLRLLSLVRKYASACSIGEVETLLTVDTYDLRGFEERVLQYEGKTLEERYNRWLYENHKVTRANIAIMRFRRKVFYLAPLIHRPVLDVAYALPPELRHGEKAYFDAMRLAFPDLWAYPTKSHYGFSLATPINLQINATRAWRKAMSTFDEIVGARLGLMLYNHPRNNYAHVRELHRKLHREDVVRCFEELKSVTLFNAAILESLKHRYLSTKPVNSFLLRGLLTVHEWYKQYHTHP